VVGASFDHREVRRVYGLGELDGGASIAKIKRGRDTVHGNIGWTESSPQVVAVAAKSLCRGVCFIKQRPRLASATPFRGRDCCLE
jgi:hypothetical protein